MSDPTEIIESYYKDAKRASDSGRYCKAATLYRRIAALLPTIEKRVVFYLLAADASLEAFNYEQAIEDCKSVFTIDPNSAVAWQTLGKALTSTQSDVEAEHAFKKSLELSPSTSSYLYLANLYMSNGRYSDAEKLCRDAIALEPDFDEAHFNLAKAKLGQDSVDEAISAFKTALQCSSDYGIVHRELGAIYLQQGKTLEAAAHLRKSIELDPNDERAVKLLRAIPF